MQELQAVARRRVRSPSRCLRPSVASSWLLHCCLSRLEDPLRSCSLQRFFSFFLLPSPTHPLRSDGTPSPLYTYISPKERREGPYCAVRAAPPSRCLSRAPHETHFPLSPSVHVLSPDVPRPPRSAASAAGGSTSRRTSGSTSTTRKSTGRSWTRTTWTASWGARRCRSRPWARRRRRKGRAGRGRRGGWRCAEGRSRRAGDVRAGSSSR